MCSILGYFGQSRDYNQIKEALLKTKTRGPDKSRIINTGTGWIGFNRLSIMGLNENGMQPFLYTGNKTLKYEDGWSDGSHIDEECEFALVCNGEIYGFRARKEELEEKGYGFISDSDCEILLPMYKEYGTKMFQMLDAEFALVIYDAKNKSFIAARDPIGIRPLYYGIDASGGYVKTFVELYPDKEPDEIKLTVKVIE